MKLTIERSVLLKSLAHVQSVVERRNTIPILSNILLEARDGTVGLTATDMDIAVVEKTAAEVTQELILLIKRLFQSIQIDIAVTQRGLSLD